MAVTECNLHVGAP
jgi:hypothetical protein